MHQDMLLEIGTEEMPAGQIMAAVQQLADKTTSMLSTLRIRHGAVKAMATPRRLVVLVTGVSPCQDDQKIEVRGPSRKVAFAENGTPTRAAEGFARSVGVDVSQLVIKPTPAGEYVFAAKVEKGQPSFEVLRHALGGLITSLSFPKPMRWGASELKFIRPIRWVLALLGDEVIPFEIDGIKSGRNTYGHHVLGPGPLEVPDPGRYMSILRNSGVIVDHEERKRIIREQVEAVARNCGGRAAIDEDLLEEVTFLVEWPYAFAGKFDPEFLKLPEEVLVTTMKHHQRYFPVTQESGRLLPFFISVRNGDEAHLDTVRQGNEKVLSARLADARFFYEEDLSIPLHERRELLKNIVFQEGFGSLYDKTERIRKLSGYISMAMGLSAEEQAFASRAAILSKADLTTNMVKEFPELEGVMGREYALAAGEHEPVARAIYEHYLPKGSDGELPQSGPGVAVCLADKIDTIVGCLHVGIHVSGSQDPYGLRRAANAFLNLLINRRISISIGMLAGKVLEFLGCEGQDLTESKRSAIRFLTQRLATLLEERGIRHDIVEAVMSTGGDDAGVDDPYDAWLRAKALAEFVKQPEFTDAMAGLKRAANLGRNAPSTNINPELFVDPEEVALFDRLKQVEEPAMEYIKNRDYPSFFRSVAGLKQAIDDFLDKVLVMTEDERVRDNRLALLRKTSEVFLAVADLSRIVVQPDGGS